ncbi:hypothetical protein ACU16_05930 [Xanthomonas oryzae pv. oryzicola]|nr:hypothetical protein ACU16_05930 [Xanthomonas oryzae pv. oryzicola]
MQKVTDRHRSNLGNDNWIGGDLRALQIMCFRPSEDGRIFCLQYRQRVGNFRKNRLSVDGIDINHSSRCCGRRHVGGGLHALRKKRHP